MNKVSIYILLVLLFLGISTNFSVVNEKVKYIPNEQVLSGFFPGSPITLILLDSFTTGFLVKTHYQKCRIINGFSDPETVIIHTNKKYWKKNLKNTGMSLFRRDESTSYESVIPMPPGTIFLNNPSFGRWSRVNSGQLIWKFHRAYKNFPKHLSWGEWRPNRLFFAHLEKHISLERATFGASEEFGTKGKITQTHLKLSKNVIVREQNDFRMHLRKLFSMPRGQQ